VPAGDYEVRTTKEAFQTAQANEKTRKLRTLLVEIQWRGETGTSAK